MSNEDTSSKASANNSDFWDGVLEGASDLETGLADTDGGNPATQEADSDTEAEHAQPDANEASTAQDGTDATATEENSNEVDASGLDAVPEEYRAVVEAAIAEREKNLQAGYTKKFQALADERKNAEALQTFAKDTGLDPDAIVQYAAAFQQLQEAPGVRITQGDQVLYESADGAQEEPDWDTMTKAEIVAHLRQENERAAKALVDQVQTSFAPIQQQQALANAQALGQAWRAKHGDVPDDVMNIAVAKAKEFEQLLPEKPPLDSVEALDKFMSPFIAQAKAMKATASTPAATPSSTPKTEVPKKETKAPRRNLKGASLEELAEAAAKNLGYGSLDDAASAFKGAQ